MVADYNASQDDVRVELDTSGVDVVSASFVRGNPPDLMLANYNMEVASMRSGGLPRTKLADTTSTPEVSSSTRTSSCDAL